MKTEDIHIHLELDYKAIVKHKADIAIIYKGRENLPVFDTKFEIGDTLHCTYQLTAIYADGIPECLAAVKRICESPDLVVKVDCAALKKQRILVYETLKQLDTLIQTVNGRIT